jgi:hypothetical protein
MAYELTANDMKKATIETLEQYQAALAAFDENKARLGKRFGLAKRQRASELLRSTRAYYAGKGAGALDLAEGREYAAKRCDAEEFTNAWNLGYYTGYSSVSNLRDLIAHNPNFAHLRAAA